VVLLAVQYVVLADCLREVATVGRGYVQDIGKMRNCILCCV